MQLTVPLQRSFQPSKALRLKMAPFSPSASGRAIAPPLVLMDTIRDRLFQLTHLWESDCNRHPFCAQVVDLILSAHPSLGERLQQPISIVRLGAFLCPFSPPISGRAIATARFSSASVMKKTFSPPISGRAIATRSVQQRVGNEEDLSAHPSLGERLQLDQYAHLLQNKLFQPTHLWESDCNSQR